MKTNLTSKLGNQLWGIYHTDREYAHENGGPLRTVIEAPTKIATEEEAARLGFSDPSAHPVAATELHNAQWLPQRQARLHQQQAHKPSRTLHA